MATKFIIVGPNLDEAQVVDGRLQVSAEITTIEEPVCENLTLFASAVRTAYAESEVQVNERAVGAYILLDITGVPGAGETLQLFVDIFQPDGSFTAIFQSAALSTTGLRKYLIYPGAVDDNSQLTSLTRLPLPRTWRIRMSPSASGNFTYAVGGYYLA